MAHVKPITPDSLAEAAAILRDGGLVAFPTETVYGLGADATSNAAVAKIFAAKNRPDFNPLISHFATAREALAAVGINDSAEASSSESGQTRLMAERARRLAHYFWPGPLTLILPKGKNCPICDLATAGLDTVALRVPAHPVARDLIALVGRPLAAPSANASGEISPTAPIHVAQSLGERVDLILAGGACAVGLESTVLDLSGDTPVILRPGAIMAPELSEILECPVTYDFGVRGEGDKPRSPGQTLRHYAPTIPIRLRAVDVAAGEALLSFGSTKFMGVRPDQSTAPNGEKPKGMAADSLPDTMHKSLSKSGDLNEAAANLFAMLRALDKPEHKGIAVMDIPETGLGLAINERLRRAAGVE